MKSIVLLLTVLAFQSAFALKLQPLPLKQLQQMKEKPCTLIHAWATWCNICIEEMPGLVNFLAKQKRINPVIVDVSAEFVQENFSKKWPVLIDAPFTSYLKPKGKDEPYMAAVDAKWDGGLPYSVFYHRGKKVKEWLGAIPLPDLTALTETACK